MRWIKNLKPKCPYCGFEFEEMPKRKRKCPECRETIYRKRLPDETEKRLITEEEAEQIERVWEAHYEKQEIEELGKQRYIYAKNELKKELQKEPTHNQIKAKYFEKEYEACLSVGNFSGYSINLSKMAWELYESSERTKALMRYLQASYLDLNGADRERFVDYRRNIPPGVLNPIKTIIEELELDIHFVHKSFTNVNAAFYHQYNPPLSPYEAWDILKEKLFPKAP